MWVRGRCKFHNVVVGRSKIVLRQKSGHRELSLTSTNSHAQTRHDLARSNTKQSIHKTEINKGVTTYLKFQFGQRM
jgi:hypothetical protein